MTQSIQPIPIKDRDPADIRKAMEAAGCEKKVLDVFLKLHDYACKQHPPLGISGLAHRTRIASSILSQCFSGNYSGDYYAIADRITHFFYLLEQQDLYGGLRQFVPTQIATGLWKVFDKTRITRRIQLVQSPEQLGKTRAAVQYCQDNNTGRTIYVKLAGGTKTGCGDFIWDLAEALSLPLHIKFREKRARIKQVLETCDLIIVDEAHLVWTWTDASAREFFDYLRTDIHSDGKRGVVLIATNSDMLKGLNSFRRRAGYNIGQLVGRMRNQVQVIDPAEDIIEADVRLLVERYYRPTADAVRRLHKICTSEQLGHFGLLDDILNESWTRAKAKKRSLCDDVVLATAGEILDELKERKDLYT
jgi:DNA transposition AAA+ family ATPase